MARVAGCTLCPVSALIPSDCAPALLRSYAMADPSHCGVSQALLCLLRFRLGLPQRAGTCISPICTPNPHCVVSRFFCSSPCIIAFSTQLALPRWAPSFRDCSSASSRLSSHCRVLLRCAAARLLRGAHAADLLRRPDFLQIPAPRSQHRRVSQSSPHPVLPGLHRVSCCALSPLSFSFPCVLIRSELGSAGTTWSTWIPASGAPLRLGCCSPCLTILLIASPILQRVHRDAAAGLPREQPGHGRLLRPVQRAV